MKKISYITAAVIFAAILFVGGFVINFVSKSNNKTVKHDDSKIPQSEAKSDAESPPAKTIEEKGAIKKPEIIKYTVKVGDTLESIAKAYGVTVNTIAISSSISVDSILKEGQELRFPSVSGILYTVKDGETLWDISTTYDINVSDIAVASGIDSPGKLKLGQELIIPGADKIQPVLAAPAGTSKSGQSSGVRVASRSGSALKSSSASSNRTMLWPVRGRISSPFGQRWGKMHKGIDIAAPVGTNVVASMGGVVTRSGWDSGGYGYLIVINHGNGFVTYYGHNSKLLVKSGEKVAAGEHIAEVGSTGDSTGPHCHFEVRKNGTPVNPINYLP